jgi:hypothetical protein
MRKALGIERSSLDSAIMMANEAIDDDYPLVI